ncbi:MAG: hypothetical protein IT353_23195 [Gemmatimonadaceae bacterium]|nr:hypothetical protein [Gemmatimonadaceae bacterium]
MRRLLAVAALAVLCAMPSVQARPLGDFGRPQPSIFHDDFLPEVGNARAGISGEPVSAFNLTDQEQEMHDRIWRFLVAPHAYDWFHDVVTELQRTRVSATTVHRFNPERYSGYLRNERYRASRVRVRTIASDALSHVDTAPSTFHSICLVIEDDRQRAVASRELGGLRSPDVAARRAENDMWIEWFVRSLHHRYESYSYALDQLLVETPHEEAIEADGRLSELAIWVDRAGRGDFCAQGGVRFGERREEAVPSRLLMPGSREGDYLK